MRAEVQNIEVFQETTVIWLQQHGSENHIQTNLLLEKGTKYNRGAAQIHCNFGLPSHSCLQDRTKVLEPIVTRYFACKPNEEKLGGILSARACQTKQTEAIQKYDSKSYKHFTSTSAWLLDMCLCAFYVNKEKKPNADLQIMTDRSRSDTGKMMAIASSISLQHMHCCTTGSFCVFYISMAAQ